MSKTIFLVIVALSVSTSVFAQKRPVPKRVRIVTIEYDEPSKQRRDPRRDIPTYSENRRALAADLRHQNRMKKVMDLQIPE